MKLSISVGLVFLAIVNPGKKAEASMIFPDREETAETARLWRRMLEDSASRINCHKRYGVWNAPECEDPTRGGTTKEAQKQKSL